MVKNTLSAPFVDAVDARGACASAGVNARVLFVSSTSLSMDVVAFAHALAQLVDVLARQLAFGLTGACGLCASTLSPLMWLGRDGGDDDGNVRFYTGVVRHRRLAPVRREFSYALRSAVVDLDAPPRWFASSGQARDHLSANEARARVGTTGKVELLTSPKSFGYAMNPISVYYCYDEEGALTRALAEVTNTPWNERVVFAFDPTPVVDERGATVPKALHVSPFMDMLGEWYISSTTPGEDVTLRVNVMNHPTYGDYFFASFKAKLDDGKYRRCRNERAGVVNLLKHGCTPHKVAYWIYKQAAAILAAGISFYAPPGLANVEAHVHTRDKGGGMCPLRPTFRRAPYWPWTT
jgi:DUF1365 family protein